MIEPALKYLASLAQESTKATLIDETAISQTYLSNGRTFSTTKAARPINHWFDSIESLARFIGQESTEDGDAAVFVNSDHVRLCLDMSGHRANIASIDLNRDPRFAILEAYGSVGSDWLDQKTFVRLLRIGLAGTLPPVALLEKVRRVKFSTEGAVSGVVARDRESMGREVASRVETTEGEIPEEVGLVVPVFVPLVDFRLPPQPIACAVEVDSARGMFRLVPLPNEVARAVRASLVALRDEVAKQVETTSGGTVPTYLGNL